MYSFEGRVRYSECDDAGRLSLVSLINYFQDCTTFQSESLGLGIARLSEERLAWVLALWRIEIDELPPLGTPIEVSTWCYEMTRAHARRNFELRGADGRSLARADSQWLVFDVDRGRATRVPAEQLVYASPEPPLEMGPLDRRLRAQGEGAPCAPLVVGSRSIDTNHHVNNAQYVRFAEDALIGLGRRVRPRTLSVLYRAQAHLGDVVTPVAYERADGWDVDLTDEAGASYALVRFQER